LSFKELFTNESLRKELNVHYLAFLNYYRITKGMLEAIEKTEAALEAEAERLFLCKNFLWSHSQFWAAIKAVEAPVLFRFLRVVRAFPRLIKSFKIVNENLRLIGPSH